CPTLPHSICGCRWRSADAAGVSSGSCCIPLIFPKAEEAVAIPLGASDIPGDRRQRFISPSLPVKTVFQNRDGMFGAVPFAHQPRADHGIARIRNHRLPDLLALDLISQSIEQLPCWFRYPAEGQFLNTIGNPPLQKGTAVVGRWRSYQ